MSRHAFGGIQYVKRVEHCRTGGLGTEVCDEQQKN